MVTPFVTLTYFLITGTLFFLLSFLIGYPLSWVFWPSKNQVLDRIVISCSLGILLFAFISYLLLFAEFSAFRETILIFSAIQWVFLALKATKGQLSYNHHTFNIHMFTRGGLALLGLIALYVFSLVRMVMTGTLYVGSSDLQFHGLVIQKISEQNGLVTDLKPFPMFLSFIHKESMLSQVSCIFY